MSHGASPCGESVAPSDTNRARWFLLGSVLVTGALYAIPYGWYVAYPLLLLSTYVHEIAHGVAATLVGGQFDFLVIHADGSGLASISVNSSPFAVAFVAGAGLVGPAVGGAALLMLAARPTLARVGLGVFALLSAVALIWVVRNIFGWLFVGLLTAGCGAAARRGTAQLAQAVVGFIGVQLALSVFSRAEYLFTEVASTGSGRHPSDVANIAEALWLPYWFWGGLCALLSVTALASGGWAFLLLSGPGRHDGNAPRVARRTAGQAGRPGAPSRTAQNPSKARENDHRPRS